MGSARVVHGDCLDVMRGMPDASVHAVVTDPPYGLEFMGKDWDSFKAVPSGGSGFSADGMGKGFKALPSYTGSPNPSCLNCGGTQRGADGQGVKRCRCDAPRFPNVRRAQSAAYGAWCEEWAAECLRVLRPGGYLLAFGGSRTFHRLACAVEDAGFQIRDSIAWLYGSGFPKSLDVGKAIDKAAGATREVKTWLPKVGATANTDKSTGGMTGNVQCPECRLWKFSPNPCRCLRDNGPQTAAAREWAGWGTALKPAFEPVVVARKPPVGTVAGNVLAWGTGALNIDACRVAGEPWKTKAAEGGLGPSVMTHDGAVGAASRADIMFRQKPERSGDPGGRWPANVALDGSQADALDQQSGIMRDGVATNRRRDSNQLASDAGWGYRKQTEDGASRFFPTFRYQAKAPTTERPSYVTADGRKISHPTVKPLGLMRWLVRLVTPPGGLVLDPFAGSGATLEACLIEGFDCIAIERDAESLPLIQQRIDRQAGTLPFEDVS